ncbi:aquaporin-4-like isoform X1 [Gadus chalcogrammus]|uniref:aquaporin-4-like isoform X1 n=2 Tax=Gadus chalcogrammus TaxID=1042646 RepID=UPI0024C4B658|nr:aquaporin-4-like isoform X1 [Gadus chalcogrammus]
MKEEKSHVSGTAGRRSSFWSRILVSRCNCRPIMVAFKGIWTKDFWRAVSGEFLATLIFVLLGLGSTINWGAAEHGTPSPPADLVLISLCFGLSIATMAQCFGHISGGHINPAVTAAMLVTRKISLAKAVFYVLAQCLGAVVGAAVLSLVTPSAVSGGLGVTMVNPKISVGHALVVELLITFQLVFTIFATCDPKRTDLGGSASLSIGLAVVIGHLFAIPYTGASMNPARSLGPALVTLNFSDHWVYWIGPVLGAILAAGLYEYLYCPDPEVKQQRPLQQSFHKDPSGIYREVGVGGGAYEGDQSPRLTVKPSSSEQTAEEEKKGFVELPVEAMSSV